MIAALHIPAARLRAFSGDTRGVTVVEFAIIAPVLGMLLLGAFDIAHSLYMRSVLQGIVQKTGRDSTLENSTDLAVQTKIDARVTAQARALANNAQVDISRRFYRSFAEAAAAKPENWTDTNKNKTCDAGEPYEDSNLNGNWDRDGGDAGQGGAKDAVVYTVTVSYPRFFPIYNFIGGSKTTKISATTVLKNQPYGNQESYDAMQVRNCA